MTRLSDLTQRLKTQGTKPVVPFLTAGYPDRETFAGVMGAAAEAGCPLVEIGIPFSDPVADGPVIQAASQKVLGQGMTLKETLDLAGSAATDHGLTVVLMGYLNPIERYGHEAFARDAAAAGVDGILMVDCPPEEMADLRGDLDEHGVYPICLVAPTTTEARMGEISRQARGYLYYVSFKGITGANRLDAVALRGPLDQLRAHSPLPLAVGFGIKDAESAQAVAGIADGVVIGSALVSRLAEAASSDDACAAASGFLAPIRAAMDNSRP